jgi:hypothetical protein
LCGEPSWRAIGAAGILHDVLDRNASLTADGTDAALELVQRIARRRDDRKFHGSGMTKK